MGAVQQCGPHAPPPLLHFPMPWIDGFEKACKLIPIVSVLSLCSGSSDNRRGITSGTRRGGDHLPVLCDYAARSFHLWPCFSSYSVGLCLAPLCQGNTCVCVTNGNRFLDGRVRKRLNS